MKVIEESRPLFWIRCTPDSIVDNQMLNGLDDESHLLEKGRSTSSEVDWSHVPTKRKKPVKRKVSSASDAIRNRRPFLQEKKEPQAQQPPSQAVSSTQQQQSKQPATSDNREELDFQFDEELPVSQSNAKANSNSANNNLSSYLPASFFPQNRRRTASLTLDLREEPYAFPSSVLL